MKAEDIFAIIFILVCVLGGVILVFEYDRKVAMLFRPRLPKKPVGVPYDSKEWQKYRYKFGRYAHAHLDYYLIRDLEQEIYGEVTMDFTGKLLEKPEKKTERQLRYDNLDHMLATGGEVHEITSYSPSWDG